MNLSSFGCNQVSHLVGRLASQTKNITWQVPEGASVEEACGYIESSTDIIVSDVHIARAGLCWMWDAKRSDLPSHDVQLWFRSTVQLKCRASFNVSPETYLSTIIDFESSGLWEYDGESPVANIGELS